MREGSRSPIAAAARTPPAPSRPCMPVSEERHMDFWVGAHLERELAAAQPEPAKVRRFVRERPGACLTDEMRRKVWLALMGREVVDAGSRGRARCSPAKAAPLTLEDLETFPQRRTVDADVPRTRADLPLFREEATRDLLTRVLIRFCRHRRMSYKQGLNEILAPVVHLVLRCREEAARDDHLQRQQQRQRLRRMAEAMRESDVASPPGSPGSRPSAGSAPVSPRSDDEAPAGEASVEDEVFTLFDTFMRSFCLWFYDDPNFRALQISLHGFRLLLQYHDPAVAQALERVHLTPELYAMPWAMTMFARGVELSQVLLLWDWMVAEQDPALWLFLGVALLRRHRNDTLTQDASQLPERLQQYQLGSAEEMRLLMAEALRVRRNTPWSLRTQLRRILRDPAPPQRTLFQLEELLGRHASLVVSPKELIRSLEGGALRDLQRQSSEGPDGSGSPRAEEASLGYVVLDIRSLYTVEDSGAGSFAKSMTLGDDVRSVEGFHAWLEQFSALRGCHICVLGPDHIVDQAEDLPDFEGAAAGRRRRHAPPHDEGGAGHGLWRRLLLGEGDGVDGLEWDGLRRGFPFDEAVALGLPMESTAAEESLVQAEHLLDDGRDAEEVVDPTMQFALCLVRRGFPNVSVCHGGMFECVQECRRLRIAEEGREPEQLEPLIIGYDDRQWQHWTSQRAKLHARFNSFRERVLNESRGAVRPRHRSLRLSLSLRSDESMDELTETDDDDSAMLEPNYVDDEVLRIRVAAAVAKDAEHHNVLAHLAVRLVDLVAAGDIPEGDDISSLMISPRQQQLQHRAMDFGDEPAPERAWGHTPEDQARDAQVCRTALATARHCRHLHVLPILRERYNHAQLLRRYHELGAKARSLDDQMVASDGIKSPGFGS